MTDTDNPIAEAKGRAKAELVLSSLWSKERDYSELILEHGIFITKDEHQDDRAMPVPDLPHLRQLYQEIWLAEQDGMPLIVPKSRQMMVTWGILAYFLARALTRKNQLGIIQSKREDDAASLLERVMFMYNNAPKWLRMIRPRVTGVKENRFKLELPSMGSKLWAIPQGADIIRSNTVSMLYSDETDFQPEGRASVRAAMPSIVGGGLAIFVSTAVQGGLVPKLCKGVW